MATSPTAIEKPSFVVRPATWAADGEALRQLRTQVFVVEQNVPPAEEWDGLDDTALHALAVAADGTPIGTVRLLESGQIGRMAVVIPWRGRGVGAALLEAIIAMAAARGLVDLWLHAQLHAIPFYARAGFVAVGPEFDDAGIPHRRMERRKE